MVKKRHMVGFHLKKFVYLFVISLMLFSCGSKYKYEIERNKNGVIIHQDSMLISIEIVNESIIHVHKIKLGSELTTIPDYVTVLEAQDVAWVLEESEDLLTVRTDVVIVFVNSDGVIEYKTIDGQKLVSETNGLTYINPKGKHTVSQSFIAGDEALYGLGQFQSGILNWKNVPNRLEQFNQEVAVPFLVSTNNYGIYWNNYSVTDFNEAQHEIKFKTLATKAKSEDDIAVDPDIENVIKHKVKSINKDENIRETTFIPKKTGVYSFFVESDKTVRMRGEIRVVIDNDTVINYKTIWVPTCYSGIKKLEAGKEYKVVFQNTGAKIAGKLLYNEPDYNKTVFSSEAGNAIDYYLIYGKNPAEIISNNHKLTGKTPLFNKKAYGFWQCRERYHNQKELLVNANEMRKRKIPFDYIVQDWFYWPERTKGPEWDRAKYPDPKAMAKEVKDLNALLMVSVWPQVINDPLLKKYDLLESKFKNNNNLDFFDEGVRERYYKMLSDTMFHVGVNSIWLDGTEPAARPSKNVKTAVGSFKEVSNIYSLLVTKAMFDGKRKEYPNERVLNLSRSAFTGQQRNGTVTWSGDVQSTWEQFAEQIPAGLNFSMSGMPYWTHDIGGFFRDANSMNPIYDNQYTNPEYIELLTRWFQFGTFSPVFRIHGYVSETEIWRYGKDFENTARKFIDLRYQLMPYIYSQAWKITNEGKMLMTPLVYHYPNDRNTWNIKNQLFFGESIMTGFVTEYKKRSMDMYFPEGEWYNYWTNEKVVGGKIISVKADLDETPMFVKAGSILPIGPKVQFATQETDEPLVIKIYPGKDAEYTLYLDDNTSYDYTEGTYSEIVFLYSEKEKKITLKKGNGDYYDFKENPMKFIFKIVNTKNKVSQSFFGEELNIQL